MKNFLFCESLAQLDPALDVLITYETQRQAHKLIMVPSESIAPTAVHEAVASVFSHIYAEGYPDERTRKMTEDEILDYEEELGHYRRYSDRRYYKGVEYADILELQDRMLREGISPYPMTMFQRRSWSGTPSKIFRL